MFFRFLRVWLGGALFGWLIFYAIPMVIIYRLTGWLPGGLSFPWGMLSGAIGVIALIWFADKRGWETF